MLWGYWPGGSHPHLFWNLVNTNWTSTNKRKYLAEKKTCKGNKLHIPICVSQFCISNILSDLLQNVNEWFQFCSPYINQITFTLNLPGNGHFSPRCLTNSLVWLKPASSQRIRSSSHYLQLKYWVAKMRGHFWFVGS